jgi:hypothetical protein
MLLWVGVLALTAMGCDGCRRSGSSASPPAGSADPQDKELVPGAIVAATEKAGGIRIYKLVEVNWFPDPMGEELVMIAYEEKADTFEQARTLWTERELTVVLPKVRVAKQNFVARDHRFIGSEPVSEQDKSAKVGDRHRKPGS